MWYDLRRHRGRAQRERVLAVVTGLLGAALLPLGIFALAVGVVMMATDDHVAVGVLTTITGVAMTGLGGLAIWRARARWRRWSELDRLATELERLPTMPPADLEVALGWPRQTLALALLEAACAGLLSELPTPLFGERGDRGELAPGDVLDGRFRLQALLGEGGMGRVFRAADVFSGGPVAVKVPRASDDQRQRLQREAELLLHVEHPHVQRLRYVGHTADGTPYVVTDLLEGESLDRRLERVGSLPWRDAVALVEPLAAALDATHAAGVLHRDLKPANVFLEQHPDGERPVLIDFGLARTLGGSAALTRSGATVGTPLYMSPEQARGEPLDARSDVYALAQLLYELIAGTPPSFDVTEAKIYERLLHQPAPSLVTHGVPPSLDAVVARGLAKDREQRYLSAGAFAAALADFEREAHHVA